MDLSAFLAGSKVAIDLGNLAANTASILQTQAASAPPMGPARRSRAAERERAYVRFQQAAVELTTWVEYLPVLQAAAPRPAATRWYAMAVAAQNWPGSQPYTPALANVLEKTLLLDETSNARYMPVLLGNLDR